MRNALKNWMYYFMVWSVLHPKINASSSCHSIFAHFFVQNFPYNNLILKIYAFCCFKAIIMAVRINLFKWLLLSHNNYQLHLSVHRAHLNVLTALFFDGIFLLTEEEELRSISYKTHEKTLQNLTISNNNLVQIYLKDFLSFGH